MRIEKTLKRFNVFVVDVANLDLCCVSLHNSG
jgi:hypothetical protein